MTHRLLFLFRMTFKNIIRHPLRGVLMVFSFTLLLSTLFLGLSMPGFSELYYTHGPVTTYAPYDLELSVDPDGTSRWFSIRPLLEADHEDSIQAIVPFFDVMTMAGTSADNRAYVRLLAGREETLPAVTDLPDGILDGFGPDEAIITLSLAERLGITEGDTVDVTVGEAGATYVVHAVVTDNKLFSGDTVFVLKASSIRLFVTAIAPSLSGFPDLFFENIVNRVYIASRDGRTDDVREVISGIDAYDTLELADTVDFAMIDQLVRRSTSVFNVIFLILIAAVLFVLHTTFLLYFEEKRRTFSVTALLGGTPAFSALSVVFEMIVFLTVALFGARALSNLVFGLGTEATGQTFDYGVSGRTILLGLIFTVLVFSVVLGMNLMRLKSSALVRLSKEAMPHDTKIRVLSVLVLVLSTLFSIIGNTVSFEGDVLVRTGIVIALALSVTMVLSAFLPVIFGRLHKKPLFGLSMSVGLRNVAFSRWLTVVMISVMSVFLLTQTHAHINSKVDRIEDEYTIDFALLNIMNGYDRIADEIGQMPDVAASDKATVFRGVRVSGQTETLNWLFSLEEAAIGDYFGFEIPDDALAGLKRTDVPVIVLPMRYHALLGYETGDPITFELSPDTPGVTMTIGGFFEKEIGDTAFSNIRSIPSLTPYPDNAILVNASGDRQTLKDALIDAYAPSLVVVMDFEEAFREKADEIVSVLSYVTLVLAVMIGCFALSVVIHAMLLAQALKSPTSSMRVLGMTDRRIAFLSLVRTMLVASISIGVSGVATFFLMKSVTDLVIHFNDYENVAFDLETLFGSVPLALVVFVPGLLVEIMATRSDRSVEVVRLT